MKHKEHYAVLDAARGIAALAVTLYHLQRYVFPDVIIAAFPDLLHRSYLAVDLFFLMSGLVIARSYEDRLLGHNLSFGGFLCIRWIRLAPLYLLGGILGFIYILLRGQVTATHEVPTVPILEAFALNAVFLPSFLTRINGMFPFDPAAWSLMFEWMINLIYAAFAVRLGTRILSVFAVLSGIALAMYAVHYGAMDMGWGLSTFTGGCLRIFFSFTLGIVMYRRLKAGAFKIPAVHPVILLTVLAIALLTPIGLNVYYDLFCVFIFFPLFVLLACRSPASDNIRPTFMRLGVLSYALYILHNPLMSWFGGIWKLLFDAEPAAMTLYSGPLILLFLTGGSYFIATRYDEPVRKYLSKKI